MELDYSAAAISAYTATYQEAVVRGRCLAVQYLYAPDGITLKCPYCEGLRVLHIWESWVIDPAQLEVGLLTSLTDMEAPIRPEEFDLKMATVCLCQDCGRWAVEQTIIGEDFRYALQAVGSLQRFDAPDDMPTDALIQHLALQRLRLRDIPPSTFERLAGEFLKSEWEECEVRHVGSSGGRGDKGVDFILVSSKSDYLVQVKHHPRDLRRTLTTREGVEFVRELNGVLFREGKAKGIFITAASGFTTEAHKEIANARVSVPGYELVLLDRLDINRWITKQGQTTNPWRKFMKRSPWSMPPWGEGHEDETTEPKGLTFRITDVDFG